jgi:predicted nucleic acid-binding protein
LPGELTTTHTGIPNFQFFAVRLALLGKVSCLRPAIGWDATRSLLSTLIRHPLDAEVAKKAGEFGRQWLPSHSSIDSADLAIAATTVLHAGSRLLTCNVWHFPMLAELQMPY